MNIIDTIYQYGLQPIKIEEAKGLSDGDSRLFIKYEYRLGDEDILRNLKRKPSYLLFEDLRGKGIIREGLKLITASSGNFAINLAIKAIQEGYRLISVVPPRIPRASLDVLKALGVDVIWIEEEFDMCPRETTVFYTRSLAERFRYHLVNIDQYYSWQNVLSHLYMTWCEIKEEFDRIDYILVGLGSTGTYMGIMLGNSVDRVADRIIGVQPPHDHHIPGVHHIIDGCEWNPEIFSYTLSDRIITIGDVDTYAWLIKLWRMGYRVGPSTAMLIAAYSKLRRSNPGDYLIISPDSITLYGELIARVCRKLGGEITSRYPELGEYMDEFVAEAPGYSNEEILDLIRRVYRPERVGEVYSISSLGDERSILKIIQS